MRPPDHSATTMTPHTSMANIQCPCITHFYATYPSGRSDPSVQKFIFLFTALDPPEWERTLELSRHAKDLGITLLVTAREEDVVSEENFRKLASGSLVWFGPEMEHLTSLHQMIDKGILCKSLMTKNMKKKVRVYVVEKADIVTVLRTLTDQTVVLFFFFGKVGGHIEITPVRLKCYFIV